MRHDVALSPRWPPLAAGALVHRATRRSSPVASRGAGSASRPPAPWATACAQRFRVYIQYTSGSRLQSNQFGVCGS